MATIGSIRNDAQPMLDTVEPQRRPEVENISTPKPEQTPSQPTSDTARLDLRLQTDLLRQSINNLLPSGQLDAASAERLANSVSREQGTLVAGLVPVPTNNPSEQQILDAARRQYGLREVAPGQPGNVLLEIERGANGQPVLYRDNNGRVSANVNIYVVGVNGSRVDFSRYQQFQNTLAEMTQTLESGGNYQFSGENGLISYFDRQVRDGLISRADADRFVQTAANLRWNPMRDALNTALQNGDQLPYSLEDVRAMTNVMQGLGLMSREERTNWLSQVSNAERRSNLLGQFNPVDTQIRTAMQNNQPISDQLLSSFRELSNEMQLQGLMTKEQRDGRLQEISRYRDAQFGQYLQSELNRIAGPSIYDDPNVPQLRAPDPNSRPAVRIDTNDSPFIENDAQLAGLPVFGNELILPDNYTGGQTLALLGSDRLGEASHYLLPTPQGVSEEFRRGYNDALLLRGSVILRELVDPGLINGGVARLRPSRVPQTDTPIRPLDTNTIPLIRPGANIRFVEDLQNASPEDFRRLSIFRTDSEGNVVFDNQGQPVPNALGRQLLDINESVVNDLVRRADNNSDGFVIRTGEPGQGERNTPPYTFGELWRFTQRTGREAALTLNPQTKEWSVHIGPEPGNGQATVTFDEGHYAILHTHPGGTGPSADDVRSASLFRNSNSLVFPARPMTSPADSAPWLFGSVPVNSSRSGQTDATRPQFSESIPRPRANEPYRVEFNLGSEPYVFRSDPPRIYVPENGGLGIEFPSGRFVPSSVEFNPTANVPRSVDRRALREVHQEFFRNLRQMGFDEVRFSEITRAGGGENVNLGTRGDWTIDLRRYDNR